MNAPRRVTKLQRPLNPGITRTLAEVVHGLRLMEGRLLRTVRQAARGDRTPEELLQDLRDLLIDLQRSYRRAVDLLDRRDLLFAQEQKLAQILQHHVWLYRRIHLEQFFLSKLRLEAQLRTLVSEEAFEIYQDIQGLDELERAFLLKTDQEAQLALREGSQDDFWIPPLLPSR
ncbi:MAG: hypothetical protein QN172_08315 [Armatimonadota bacterium]|nr:hypothetical protein [Armatimonadota bacterium]MDR7439713.1 hypothetical protein [Armatimonadota bacterium]MDR7562559.1 hypothetical protein [Armatimonadota bacterium]MDR7566893.1 hypothetical protein [Armatimonadota bacterium]MDR7602446.1 hypothetical protein [Armatimonadota bacterium]